MEVSAQLQAPTATLGFSVRSQLLLLMAVVSTAQGQCNTGASWRWGEEGGRTFQRVVGLLRGLVWGLGRIADYDQGLG